MPREIIWTPERIAETRALCNDATHGPWVSPLGMGMMVCNPKTGMHIADIRGWGYLTGVGGMKLSDVEAQTVQQANALFIATSRTALPEALREIERCHAEIMQLKLKAPEVN